MALATVLMLLCCSILRAEAQDHAVHWEKMEYILFGEKQDLRTIPKGKQRVAIKVLRYATQLCIDQHGNDSCKSYYDELVKLGVPRMPKDFSSITVHPSYAGAHRKYTHLGWTHKYISERNANPDWAEVRWPKRQQILRDSVEFAFNFNGLPTWIDRIFLDYNAKREYFCAFLYYIHILVDHTAFKDLKNYNEQIQYTMPLFGAVGEGDTVISELIKYTRLLFGDDAKYLIERLEVLNSELISLSKTTDSFQTGDCFGTDGAYTACVNRIIDALHEKVPGLLNSPKNKWWTDVFPTTH